MSYSVLAISGSLRAGSVNNEVVRAVQLLAPANIVVNQFAGIAELPYFNPDNELNTSSNAVANWRAQLQLADAVVICSPEYAHGVPGVLKNALDWVVGTGEFMSKPVALINASPNSKLVGPQLTETLTVMMGNVITGAAITLSMAGKKRDAASMVADETISAELKNALTALTDAVNALKQTAETCA
ncbi:MAG: NADPH-dependent FMN reductase [Gemmatimonadaceae bacterium]